MAWKSPESPFDLGGWRVEPARGLLQLRASGREVRLEPRLMDLLLLFATSDGRVLSKDDIISRVWGGRVVGDDTLASAISRLRSALGETRDERYIETVPKRGYRFVLDVPAQGNAARTTQEIEGRAAQFMRQGEAALRTPFAASLAEARHAFESAVQEEPSRASAHAGLAETLLAIHMGGGSSSVMPQAKSAALAAIGIDKSSPRAWSVLGMCKLLMHRDFKSADQDLSHAITLDRELASARSGRAFALAAIGRFVEAEREARKAVELDSISMQARNLLLQILIAARRYQWTIVAANETLALAPYAAEGWYAKGWAQAFLGDEASGVDAFLNGLKLWGLPQKKLGHLKSVFGTNGFGAGCSATAHIFEEQGLMFRPRNTDIAILRVAAQEFDQAFAALERALRHDDPFLLFLPWLPYFDPIRKDPRYAPFLARIRPVR